MGFTLRFSVSTRAIMASIDLTASSGFWVVRFAMSAEADWTVDHSRSIVLCERRKILR